MSRQLDLIQHHLQLLLWQCRCFVYICNCSLAHLETILRTIMLSTEATLLCRSCIPKIPQLYAEVQRIGWHHMLSIWIRVDYSAPKSSDLPQDEHHFQLLPHPAKCLHARLAGLQIHIPRAGQADSTRLSACMQSQAQLDRCNGTRLHTPCSATGQRSQHTSGHSAVQEERLAALAASDDPPWSISTLAGLPATQADPTWPLPPTLLSGCLEPDMLAMVQAPTRCHSGGLRCEVDARQENPVRTMSQGTRSG